MAIFDEPSRKALPQPTFEDTERAARKGLVSMIPIVGGVASELLALLASPVAERRDEWFCDLERRLRELESQIKGFNFEDLAQNEQFVSATLQATQAALRTHSSEKHVALQNAVLNIAAGSAPDDDLQSIFLSLIDSMTPLHLRLLARFRLQHPVKIGEAPEWLKADVCPQVAKDLLDRGLLAMPGHLVPDRDRLITGQDGVYRFNAGLSRLGDQFFSFITSPPAASGS